MPSTTPLVAIARATKTFVTDIAEGVFATLHHGLLVVGAAAVAAAVVLAASPNLRTAGQQQLGSWLTAREIAATGIKPDYAAITRSTAINPVGLNLEQARLAQWISKKYRVAPEPVAAMVREAYNSGKQNNLDPIVILAVAAIESNFNPFAQSQAGAQGLMQVMTKVHADKYAYFGGNYAAFDPKSNLRVGVRILHDYIEQTGSLQAGLKWYVGAANLNSDGGYAAKVIAEYKRMYKVAYDRPLPPEALLRAEYGDPSDSQPTQTRVALAP